MLETLLIGFGIVLLAGWYQQHLGLRGERRLKPRLQAFGGSLLGTWIMSMAVGGLGALALSIAATLLGQRIRRGKGVGRPAMGRPALPRMRLPRSPVALRARNAPVPAAPDPADRFADLL